MAILVQSNKKPSVTFPTLAGSIVTFNSQYAGLPLKSCKVAISSQSGVSAININVCGANLCENVTLEQGTFNSSNGNPQPSNTRVRTADYISLSSGTYRVSTSNNMFFVLYVYNASDDSFLSAESVILWQNNPYTFNVADNRKIKLGIRKDDSSVITPEDVEGLFLWDTSTLTEFTIPIGQTVNEGEYDARTGILEVTSPSEQTIQLPPCPIDTLQGMNNIWANTGDTTVSFIKIGG